MASHAAERGEVVVQKNRVLEAKVSCNCKEITDNILIMCNETCIKTTHEDISNVSNSKKPTNYAKSWRKISQKYNDLYFSYQSH
jgi:hypothetical protein